METKDQKITDKDVRKALLLNQVDQKSKVNGSSANNPLNQKAKVQKVYMGVKIETDIVNMFKRIVYENNLESHGIIMNSVLRNWANEILENS